MSNMAAAFRQEITRLARREIRGQLVGLRRASTRFRKDIARLKRDAADLMAQIGRLRRFAHSAPAAARAPDQAKIRFTAKGVLAHRRRLKLSAADYGRLVGVTGHTIYAWEHGSSRPRRSQLAALAALRSIGRREALARLGEARAPRRARRQS